MGVSRSGKTPTSLYLAMQHGLKAANYPLIPEDFDLYSAFMPRLSAQRSHVSCLHESNLGVVQINSSTQGPDQ